ncbi:MAG TPA: hypothetical protein VNI54_04995 [Thermoanaerobaculia bacterium]|nr:hypothetical protein [Thermoanaerobaculia bacterium]
MIRRLLIPLVFVCLCAVGVSAQPINVTGHAHLYAANCPPGFPYCYHFSNGKIKLCSPTAAGTPSNSCSTFTTNATGYFSFSVAPGNYFVYLWYDGEPYYGSPDYPHFFGTAPAPPSYAIWEIQVLPRPYPPRAIYPPHGEHDVSAPAIQLEWTAGIDDPQRNNPAFIVTYDIYASGQEFPEIKVLSDVACPLAYVNNRCSIPIGNLVHEVRYQWRVVAKMRSSLPVQGAGVENAYFAQSSPTFRFSTTWSPTSPPINILTANNSYFKAPDGGGAGTLAANGTSNTWETQFKFQDINGGTLNAGDSVCIYSNRGYYLQAIGGQGTVTTNTRSCGAYETWAFEPVNGGVAFRHTWSNYYMSATNGGGGTVTVSATTPGPNETFKLQ